jgi:F-type H+-transporting ATPase subunit b
MVDERRRAIAESMEKAKEIEQRKQLLEQERAEILRKADIEGGVLLQRAKDEAEAMRAEIEKAAHAHAEQLIKKGLAQIEAERAHVVKDIQTKLAHTIVSSAEKILRREFSAEDQAHFEEELKKNLPSLLS